MNARVYGPEDPRTLESVGSLAAMLTSTGRFNEAIPVFERLIPVLQRTLGPVHDITLLRIGTLACSYRYAGQLAKAEAFLTSALEPRMRDAGASDQAVGTLLFLLGQIKSDQGKLEEARAVTEESLTLMQRAYGPADLSVYRTRQAIANFDRSAGDLAKAELGHAAVLQDLRGKLGESHADTVYAGILLGETLLARKQTGRAATVLEHAWENGRKGGKAPREGALAQALLGVANLRQQRWEEAESALTGERRN